MSDLILSRKFIYLPILLPTRTKLINETLKLSNFSVVWCLVSLLLTGLKKKGVSFSVSAANLVVVLSLVRLRTEHLKFKL